MVLSKACPRCSGYLMLIDDDFNPYLSCFHCGHVVYRASPPPRPALQNPR